MTIPANYKAIGSYHDMPVEIIESSVHPENFIVTVIEVNDSARNLGYALGSSFYVGIDSQAVREGALTVIDPASPYHTDLGVAVTPRHVSLTHLRGTIRRDTAKWLVAEFRFTPTMHFRENVEQIVRGCDMFTPAARDEIIQHICDITGITPTPTKQV